MNAAPCPTDLATARPTKSAEYPCFFEECRGAGDTAYVTVSVIHILRMFTGGNKNDDLDGLQILRNSLDVSVSQ